MRDFQALRKLKKYDKQRHFEGVVKEYEKAVRRISAPHVGWYDFKIPTIDVNAVKKELLSRDEVLQCFKLDECTFGDLVEQGKVTYYRVRERHLIRRQDLARIPT